MSSLVSVLVPSPLFGAPAELDWLRAALAAGSVTLWLEGDSGLIARVEARFPDTDPHRIELCREEPPRALTGSGLTRLC